jgi:AcrR family transcriptional regulator
MQGTYATAAAEQADSASGGALRRRAGRPSIREAARKHEAMLEAALEEFSRHGFHGASVRAIAERAGLSTRTLYNRYADKVALFAACMEMSALQGAWEPRRKGGSLHDDLVQFATHVHTRLNEDRHVRLARIIFRECTSFPQLEPISRRQFERFQLEPVQQILTAHGFKPSQVQDLAKSYVALTFHRWQSRVIYDERPLTPAEIQRQVRGATTLFLQGAIALRDGA